VYRSSLALAQELAWPLPSLALAEELAWPLPSLALAEELAWPLPSLALAKELGEHPCSPGARACPGTPTCALLYPQS